MSELPVGWASVNLGEVTEKIGSGATPKGGEQSYKSVGVPLIRSMNVHFNGFHTDGLAFLDDAQAAALDGVTVRASDVLLNITGASIGRVTTAPDNMDGARVNQHVCIIRPLDGLEPRYIGAFLASPDMQRFINEENYGVTRQALTKGMIEGFSIPVAPLSEQHRIVAKLDSLRARSARARHELDLVPKLIERYKQAILAKAFSGELTADWREANPTSGPASLLVKRAKAASGTTRPSKQVTRKLLSDAVLPASWASERLENLCSLIVDGTHFTPTYTPHGVPFISVKDIRDRKIYFDDCRYVSEQTHEELSARCNPTHGDVLLTKSGTIGRLAVVQEGQKFSLFVSVALLRPAIPDFLSEFLMYALEFWIANIDISQEIVGSAIKNLHLQDIKALEAPVPPADEQVEILRRLANMFSWLDKIATEHARAAHLLPKLDQAILAKAFRGELVPQDPNDEPASALLERIRSKNHENATQKRQRKRG